MSTPLTTSVSTSGFKCVYVIQIPVPTIGQSINGPALALAALTPTHIPQALTWLTANGAAAAQKAVAAATALIKALPTISVVLQVKVGPVAVINVQLTAEAVPTAVSAATPKFALGLPNIAVGAGISVPVPSLPPIAVKVPIPVPVPAVTLGSVSVSGGTATGSAAVLPVTNPIRLPAL